MRKKARTGPSAVHDTRKLKAPAPTTTPRFDDPAHDAFVSDFYEDPNKAFLGVIDRHLVEPRLDKQHVGAIFDGVWKDTAPHLPPGTALHTRLWPILRLRIQHAQFGVQKYLSLLAAMGSTPTLDQFLLEVGRILQTKDGGMLQDYLVLEPKGGSYPPIYTTMIQEIRQAFPKGTEDGLEEKCNQALLELQELDDGSSWSAFVRFIAQYFTFLRDIDVENLGSKQLEAYKLLAELVSKCNSALNHPSMGVVILPTVIACSRMLATLAITLDKRPELIEHVRPQGAEDDGSGQRTLGEKAAEILRIAFVTCLNDRTGNTATGVRDGKPDGKRVGIYKIANLCLKILFQGQKSRSAETIFNNIQNLSPPLSVFPWPERVTYLYYLGRFHFSNNHFYRAQLALQAAYDQCNVERFRQRRLILIYLVASNMVLGRFPSQLLYQQPEAAGLRERFGPVCRAVAKGDLTRFRLLLDVEKGEHADWFLYHRILFQLRNRCEVLVWRSLVRRTFLIHGEQGDPTSRKAPTVDLQDLVVLARFLEKKALHPEMSAYRGPGQRHANWAFFSMEPPKKLLYVDPDFEGADAAAEFLEPDMDEIESIVASLVDQGLLGGFISHRQLRFAIQGAKRRGALAAGFPNAWAVIKARSSDDVPGWKKDSPAARSAGGFGGSRVINLSGARPVGVAGA